MSQIPDLNLEVPREEKLYYYQLAGKIAYEVFEEITPMVKPGAKLLDICDKATALILEKGGFKVGVASTILFKVAKKEKLNDKKMTPGRWAGSPAFNRTRSSWLSIHDGGIRSSCCNSRHFSDAQRP